MRTLTLFALVTVLTQTGCFFRSRGLVTAYTPAAAAVNTTAGMTAGAYVGGNVGASTTTTSTQVTVNGRPATATVQVNGGSATMNADSPGASVSATATVAAPTP